MQDIFAINTTLGYAGVPLITVAGREWFVPRLAFRQTRAVVPGLMQLMPILLDVQPKLAAGDMQAALAVFTEEQLDRLGDIVHVSLTRAYPNLTREAFLDLEITPTELMAAIGTITKQTGMFSEAGAPNTGEAEAGATTSPQTSTGSSPIIASPAESLGPMN